MLRFWLECNTLIARKLQVSLNQMCGAVSLVAACCQTSAPCSDTLTGVLVLPPSGLIYDR